MEKYDKELEEKRNTFENGPIANRKSTDILCCLIFIVAIVAFCAASAYGWMNGDPSKLLIGWDSDRNGCGYSESVKDYPYLYWPEEPAAGIKDAIESLSVDKAISLLNGGVCVKECPSSDKTTIVDCKPTSSMLANPKFSTETN